VLLALLPPAAVAGSSPGSTPIEEEPIGDLLDLMDDDLDRASSVADRVARSQREAPALVTVLTGEELERLGARDLTDALRLMPGVSFGTDLWNTDLLLTRGTMDDGRVLLLVDDHEWNELVYGSTPWANRIPIAVIDRIEVVQGPGSAVYGGYAMLGVVRVVTKSAAMDGVRVDAEHSWLRSGAYGRRDVSVSAGGTVGKDGHLGISAVLGEGRRSDSEYTDVKGRVLDLTDVSHVDPGLVSTTLDIGHLSAALAAEHYRVTWQDGGQRVARVDRDNDFVGLYGRAALTEDLSPHTTVTGRVFSNYQEPWRNTRNVALGDFAYFLERVFRTGVGASLASQPLPWLGTHGGAEVGTVRGDAAPGMVMSWDPSARFAFGDAWVEAVADGPVGDLTAGVRVDSSTSYGEAVSPRIVLVEAQRRFHYKLGVNRAFRSPGIAQLGPDVVPETTTSLDAELGVAPTPWSYVTASAFDSWLDDPFLYRYRYDPLTGEETDGYVNGRMVHTAGFELDVEVLSGPVRASAGWARSMTIGEGPVDYRAPIDPANALGIPGDKGVLRLSWDPGERLVLGGVGSWVGPRSAVVGLHAGTPEFAMLPPAVVLDASAGLRDLWVRGLTLSASVHDLLDRAPAIPQPYTGMHAPTPGSGRELLLRVTVER
jgi:outer membrane receptor protein involved in Fe transport